MARLLKDILPARISYDGEERYPRARAAIITDPNEVLIWLYEGKEAKLSVVERYNSYDIPRSARDPHTVVLESGEIVTIQKDGGCGCGSPLRRVSLASAIRARQNA